MQQTYEEEPNQPIYSSSFRQYIYPTISKTSGRAHYIMPQQPPYEHHIGHQYFTQNALGPQQKELLYEILEASFGNTPLRDFTLFAVDAATGVVTFY